MAAGKGERQTSLFTVKAQHGIEQLPSKSCSTNDGAMEAAFTLFDQHGTSLEIRTYWKGRLLYGPRKMLQFYAQRLKDRKV